MDEQSQKQLAEITAKSPADLTEADAAFLRARRSYLTEEQRVTFAAALEVGEPPAGGTPAADEQPAEPAPKKKAVK
jgi:hypothetical protein